MSESNGRLTLQEAPPLATAGGDVFVQTGLPLSGHTSAIIHCDSDKDGRSGSTFHPNS